MTTLNTKNVHKMDPGMASCAHVRPGEVFTVKLTNAFGKSFESTSEFESFLSEGNEVERKRVYLPCAGPVEVITDQQDISVAVRIVDFKVTRGYQGILPSSGLLRDVYREPECTIYNMGNDQTLHFKNDDLLMRGSPKLGFIATLDDKIRQCDGISENGGKIDLNFIDRGSVVYLPINSATPRLLFGELHICQGNGQGAGFAVEADGEVTMEVTVVDKVDFPVIDHKHYLTIVGWGSTLEETLQKGTHNTIKFLQRVFPFCHWTEGELYKFISAEGNLTIGNASGNAITCGVVFYKPRLTNKFGFSVF